MYDPTIARFLQEDSYTGNVKDPLSLNLYTYCHNNPVIYDDPTGHWEHIVIGAIVGAAIGVACTALSDKPNKTWKDYVGAAVSGAITGGAAAATGGASLAVQVLVGGATAFAGSVIEQKIVNGKVDYQVKHDSCVGCPYRPKGVSDSH